MTVLEKKLWYSPTSFLHNHNDYQCLVSNGSGGTESGNVGFV